MTWHSVWETVHRERTLGRYPPEELIRFVLGSYGRVAERDQVRILEIGCGAGANLWFLAREGFDCHGLDASPTALARCRSWLRAEGLSARLVEADIDDMARYFEPDSLDAVIDICCLQCNPYTVVSRAVGAIATLLKPGGRFFAMLSSQGSWGDGLGRQVAPHTYADIAEGPYLGLGRNHFFTLDEVHALGEHFAESTIEYTERTLEGMSQRIGHWLLSARRADGA